MALTSFGLVSKLNPDLPKLGIKIQRIRVFIYEANLLGTDNKVLQCKYRTFFYIKKSTKRASILALEKLCVQKSYCFYETLIDFNILSTIGNNSSNTLSAGA
jgi:hypothetical protein